MSSTAFLEVVSSKTRFTNASVGDTVFYNANPNKSIHLGTLLGSNSAMTIQGSNVTINGGLSVNGSTITNGGSLDNTLSATSMWSLGYDTVMPTSFVAQTSSNYNWQSATSYSSTSSIVPSTMWPSSSNIVIPLSGIYTIAYTVATDVSASISSYCKQSAAQQYASITHTGTSSISASHTSYFEVDQKITWYIKSSAPLKARDTYISLTLIPLPRASQITTSTPAHVSIVGLWYLTTSLVLNGIQPLANYTYDPLRSYSSSTLIPTNMFVSSVIQIPTRGIYTMSYTIVTESQTTISSYILDTGTYTKLAQASITGTNSITASHTSMLEANKVLNWNVNTGISKAVASHTYISITLLVKL